MYNYQCAPAEAGLSPVINSNPPELTHYTHVMENVMDNVMDN